MKITTLTSTLILTSLMAVPQAMAMEAEEKKETGGITVAQQKEQDVVETGDSSVSVTKGITEEDFLTYSVLDFDSTKLVVKGSLPNATAEDKEAARKALEVINTKREAKREKTKVANLAEEEKIKEDARSWLYSLLWGSSKKAEQEDILTDSTPLVITTPVEEKSETSSSSWNPFSWNWWGKSEGTSASKITTEDKQEKTADAAETVASPESTTTPENGVTAHSETVTPTNVENATPTETADANNEMGKVD